MSGRAPDRRRGRCSAQRVDRRCAHWSVVGRDGDCSPSGGARRARRWPRRHGAKWAPDRAGCSGPTRNASIGRPLWRPSWWRCPTRSFGSVPSDPGCSNRCWSTSRSHPCRARSHEWPGRPIAWPTTRRRRVSMLRTIPVLMISARTTPARTTPARTMPVRTMPVRARSRHAFPSAPGTTEPHRHPDRSPRRRPDPRFDGRRRCPRSPGARPPTSRSDRSTRIVGRWIHPGPTRIEPGTRCVAFVP